MPYKGLVGTTTNSSGGYQGLTGQRRPDTFGEKATKVSKEIAKDPIKALLVTPAARTTEAVTRVAFPNSLAAKGYEEMQRTGESQVFKAPLLGDIEVKQQKGFGQGGATQIAGQAAHAASYILPFTRLPGAIGQATVTGGTKLTAANLAKAKLAGYAGEGAVSGVLGLGGITAEEGGTKGEIAKSAMIGAGLGLAAPLAFSAIGRGYKGLMGKKAPVVPETTVKPPTQATEQAIERAPANRAVEPITDTTVPPVTRETATQAPIRSIPPQVDNVERIQRQTVPEQDRIALEQGWDVIEKTVFEDMPSSSIPAGTNKGVYVRLLFNEADRLAKLGDTRLSRKLTSSNALANFERQTGQELGALAGINEGNITKSIRKAILEAEDALPTAVKNRKMAEITNFENTLKKIIKEVDDTPVSRQNISDLIDSIIC